jgi:hypothetical protein
VLNRLKAVFRSFHSNEVRYVVIGGIAAILHGVPRATFDLDILIEANEANAERLLRALRSIGFGTAELTNAQRVATNEITVFNDRVRIDVLTSAPGITFEEAWERRETMEYEGQVFHVACRDDIIVSKQASGREKDLNDVRALKAHSDKSAE